MKLTIDLEKILPKDELDKLRELANEAVVRIEQARQLNEKVKAFTAEAERVLSALGHPGGDK